MPTLTISVETDYRFGEILDLLEDAEADQGRVYFHVVSVTDTRDRPEIEADYVLELSGREEEDVLETLLNYVPILSYTVERELDD